MSKATCYMGTAWVLMVSLSIIVGSITGSHDAGLVAVFVTGIPLIGIAYVKSGLYERDKREGKL